MAKSEPELKLVLNCFEQFLFLLVFPASAVGRAAYLGHSMATYEHYGARDAYHLTGIELAVWCFVPFLVSLLGPASHRWRVLADSEDTSK